MSYSALVIIKIGKCRWQLKEPWRTPFITVPPGFVTDGASIPRLAWPFSAPSGEFFEAAVIHDYLYEHGIGTKRQADQAFYQTALRFGVTPWKAKLAYQAVKLFGLGSFHQKQ